MKWPDNTSNSLSNLFLQVEIAKFREIFTVNNNYSDKTKTTFFSLIISFMGS